MHCPLVLAFMLCLFCMPAWSYHRFGEAKAFRSDNPDVPGRFLPVTGTFESEASALPYLNPPTIANPIPEQEISVTAGAFLIDLEDVFSSSDGSSLAYTTLINNATIATVSIVDQKLQIIPLNIGQTRIRVTATDREGERVSDFFTLRVRSNSPPRLILQSALSNQTMLLDGVPYSLNLLSVFEDPDADPLVFSVAASTPDVVTPVVNEDVLTVSPVEAGVTDIIITVDDTQGGVTEVSFRLEVIRPYPGELVTTLAIPFQHPDEQTSYRMIGLPGNQLTPITFIADGLPTLDWVAYAADSTASGELVPFNGTLQFQLKPGNGLWFLQKRPWALQSQAIPTVPLTSLGTYVIQLHEGWNIISNPFDVDIAWKDVAERNGLSQGIWRWDGDYVSVDTFYTSTRQAEAFYFNNVEGVDEIALPYPGLASPFLSKTVSHGNRQDLSINAAMGTRHQASVSVGFNDGAATGPDRFDQFVPPPHFSLFGLVIEGGDEGFNHAPLARDVRPLNQQSLAIPLTLYAAEGARIRFDVEGIVDLPFEDAILVNLLDTQVYDVQAMPSFSMIAEARQTPLLLVLGDAVSVDEKIDGLKPLETRLKQNYPNPFSTETTIEYSLPEAQPVVLRIFDLLGRHLVTLFDGYQEPGLHRVVWDGYDKARTRVSSGIYLYQFQAGRTMLSKKLVVH